MRALDQKEAPARLRGRALYAVWVALLGFLGLVGRLWYLQVLHGPDLRVLSDNNRIRLQRVQATRGTIVDRYGRVLVDSRPSFDAVLVPEDTPNVEETIETLAVLLGMPSHELQAQLQAPNRPAFREVILKRDLSFDELAAIETHQVDLPGISVQITPRRSYPLGPAIAHVSGYVGEVSGEELKSDPSYRMGDLVGKTGLERRWEKYLRGQDGGQQVEVDSLGRRLRVLKEVEETPGHTLRLTIDRDLQLAADRALGGRAGSLVVLDPRTGEVLAMVNHPSFDPNIFARGVRGQEWSALLRDRAHPLMNRAIQGQYPPGSTFKFIVAVAALQEGVINPFTSISCPGGLQFGNRFFRCWKKGGHGSVNVHQALVHSCDTFFYQVGQRLGVDVIAQYARLFGLGERTEIELDHERPGTIPDSAWKLQRFGQPWFPGETLSVSIGQGYVSATPLQMANALAMLATGVRFRPSLVREVESPEGEVVFRHEPQILGELSVRPIVLKQVRDALRDVVERGTGKNARIPGISVAGKTGTSQVVRLGRERRPASQLAREHRDHAWFVAYAPTEDPEIVVAAVVEHAEGGGGAVAAPLVRAVIQEYFSTKEQGEKQLHAENRSAVARAF